jgi:predicted alpha/beta superfamily hydrolase
MSRFPLRLSVAALIAGGVTFVSPADRAHGGARSEATDSMPACDDWLANRVTARSLGVDQKALERLKGSGVTIEPGRRMRAADYPWEHYIQVALPPSYRREPERRFPVLWVTDGQTFFSLVTEIVTSCAGHQLPEMIVVAIGSTPEADQSRNEIQARRSYDFSPNEIMGYRGFGGALFKQWSDAAEEKLRAAGKLTNSRLGGAPRLLPFLVDDVRNQLARDYRMADDHTLFGHSGGGLFCSYALVARPTGFNRYVCGSPSLAAGDYEVFRLEERYAAEHRDLAAAVFFGAGEDEILQGGVWGLVSSMARMAELLKLRAYPSLALTARIFPGENHVSVIPLVVGWGLRAVWARDSTGQGGRR